jgi:putative sigma-54 modulation protein
MQINLSGHHVEITDGIREAVDSRFTKVGSHHPQLDEIAVIVTVDKNEQSVEAISQYMGAPVVVQSSDKDLYAAIAAAAKKFDSALSHRKGATKATRHA